MNSSAPKNVGAEERDRVKIEVERLPGDHVVIAEGRHPTVEQGGQPPRPEPARVLTEIRRLGQHVEAGPQGQPLVEHEIHDVTAPFGARQLERQSGPDRRRGRDHAGAREPRRLDQLVELQTDQPGHEQEQAPHGGGEAARSHPELADIGDGGAVGPRALGPLFVAAAWQARKAFGAQDLVNGGETESTPLPRQGVVDVVDRQVLLA